MQCTGSLLLTHTCIDLSVPFWLQHTTIDSRYHPPRVVWRDGSGVGKERQPSTSEHEALPIDG